MKIFLKEMMKLDETYLMWLDVYNKSRLDYRDVTLTTLTNEVAPILQSRV